MRNYLPVAKLISALAFSVTVTITAAPTAAAPTQETAEEIPDSKNAVEESSTWELENQNSSVIFAVSHNGLSYLYGRFKTCSGTINLDLNDPGSARFHFEIDPRSVDTNEFTRDIALRGPKFFDVGEFVSIEFDSINVEVKDNLSTDGKKRRTFVATGNFLMHGETRKIVMPLELLAVGKGTDGKLRCGFISKFVIRRSDHGMEEMADTIGDSMAITFSFQAVQKEKKTPAIAPSENEIEFNVFQSGESKESGSQSENAGTAESDGKLIER